MRGLFVITSLIALLSCSDNSDNPSCEFQEIMRLHLLDGDVLTDKGQVQFYDCVPTDPDERCFQSVYSNGNIGGGEYLFFKAVLLVDGEVRLYYSRLDEALLNPDSHFATVGTEATFDCDGLKMVYNGYEWDLTIQ